MDVTATGASLLVDALASHGVDIVFGIPGTHNVPVYECLARRGIRLITPRHEQGAGYAADGYARVTGRPGVVLTTTGPGLLNAATAVAQAYSDSIPLLVISPGMPTGHPRQSRGELHESKAQSAALDALCAWSHRVMSVPEIPAAVARAFGLFGEGRPRPVHIEIPQDLFEATVDSPKTVAPYRIMPRPPDPAALDAAARLLVSAVRPGIVLGGGTQDPDAQRIGRLALELAERLEAGIITTLNGKGVIPETHRLALGSVLHLESARRWLAECDVVLAAGTELGPSDLWVSDFSVSGRLIRIDVDPGQMYGDHVADVPIVADAELALRGLLDRVDHVQKPPFVQPDTSSDLSTVASRWIPMLDALDGALPRETVVVGDNSMSVYHGAIFRRADPPGRFLFPTGYGTLGYALPAAIGAKLGRPDRPVVALAGDGALQFSIQELATAVELGLTLPIVVSDNGGYGEIREVMLARGMDPVAVEVPGPDLVLLAAAYGAEGHRVDNPDELAKAVADALRSPGPTVIVITES